MQGNTKKLPPPHLPHASWSQLWFWLRLWLGPESQGPRWLSACESHKSRMTILFEYWWIVLILHDSALPCIAWFKDSGSLCRAVCAGLSLLVRLCHLHSPRSPDLQGTVLAIMCGNKPRSWQSGWRWRQRQGILHINAYQATLICRCWWSPLTRFVTWFYITTSLLEATHLKFKEIPGMIHQSCWQALHCRRCSKICCRASWFKLGHRSKLAREHLPNIYWTLKWYDMILSIPQQMITNACSQVLKSQMCHFWQVKSINYTEYCYKEWLTGN